MLLVWLAAWRPNTNPLPQYVLMLADETGQAGGQLVNPNTLAPAFRTFPRRASHLTLLWFRTGREGLQLVAKNTLPNPGYSTAPSWRADTLPLTRTDGDLECILERVGFVTLPRTHIVPWMESGQPVDALPARRGDPFMNAAARLTFRQHGVPTDTWTIETVEMRDATGNELKSDSIWAGAKADPAWFYWCPPLWPNETWEVRFCAKRTADGVFTRDELARFTDLPLGAPGITTPWLRHTNLPGLKITLEDFTAHKTIDYGYGIVQTNQSELRMTTSEPDFDLLRISDNEGKRYHPSGISMMGQPGTYDYTYTFKDIPIEATNLNIDIAIQSRRYFTFSIKPQLVTPDATGP